MSVRTAGPRGSSASGSKAATTAAQELRDASVCAAEIWHLRSGAGAAGPARRGFSQLRSCRSASGVGLAPAWLVVVRALRALNSLMHQECQNLGACRRPCTACRPAACCYLLHEVQGTNEHAGAENMNAHE